MHAGGDVAFLLPGTQATHLAAASGAELRNQLISVLMLCIRLSDHNVADAHGTGNKTVSAQQGTSNWDDLQPWAMTSHAKEMHACGIWGIVPSAVGRNVVEAAWDMIERLAKVDEAAKVRRVPSLLVL